MIIGLIPLLVIGAIVAGIVAVVRHRREEGSSEAGDFELRRVFLYGLLFLALVLTAIGATGLLELVLPDSGVVAGDETAALARNLAFVIVAGPAYGLLWWGIRRRESADADLRSFSWAAYVGLAQLTALVVTLTAGAELLVALFPIDDGGGSALAPLVVWGAVWAWHWWLFRSDSLRPTMGRSLIPLAGSAIGLATGAVSLGALLSGLFGSAYDSLVAETVAGAPGAGALWEALAWLLPATGVWAWYWLAHGVRLERDRLWHGYTLLLGVLAPIIAVLGSGGTVLALVLVWLLGDPSPAEAAAWFDPVPAALATVLVGGVVWAYHRLVLGSSPEMVRSEPGRAYRYLMAAAGLVAAATGVAIVVQAALQAIARPVTTETPVNALLYGVTALAVGLPVWWSSWRSSQAAVATDPEAEIPSPSRRVYLTIWFGAVGLVALVSLVVVVYQLVEGILEGDSGSAVLDAVRIPLGILLAAGAVGIYHWAVWRSDRALAPAEAPRRVRHVLLVGGDDVDRVAAAIRDETGAHVAVWHRLDDGHLVLDARTVIDRLEEVDEPRVLVIAEDRGPEIIPYRP